MATKTDTISEVSPDDLNRMIAALGREKGLPAGIHPDLTDPDDPDNDHYWGNGQEERYRESVAWRRRLIAELRRRPNWVGEWFAVRDLDRRIEALCRRKGLEFKPWECPPWRAPDEVPEIAPGGWHMYGDSMAPAVRLRRRLIAELERS
jgi:hypothetical protein